MGLRGDLRLQGAGKGEAAATAEVLGALISQRRGDRDRLEQMEAAQAVMQSDLRAAEGTRRRLQTAVAGRDRDLGQLENQVTASASGLLERVTCEVAFVVAPMMSLL